MRYFNLKSKYHKIKFFLTKSYFSFRIIRLIISVSWIILRKREFFSWKVDFSGDDLTLCIQWNLSIADKLYRGHLTIADTYFRNQLCPVMVKPLYLEPLYSRHLSIANTFFGKQWCPLLRGFTVSIISRIFLR